MLIRCALSKDNLQNWQKNSKEATMILSIIASKSKYAPTIPKIVYSIIELAKSIFGSSNYQRLFRSYKNDVIRDLKKDGIDANKYKNKDFRLSFNYGINYSVLDNDLQIKNVPEKERENSLKLFEKQVAEDMERRGLIELVRK